MSQFVGSIELQYQMDKVYPANFEDFESKDKTKDVSKDIRGTTYRLEILGDGFAIVSAGIDKTFGTKDDARITHKRKSLLQ